MTDAKLPERIWADDEEGRSWEYEYVHDLQVEYIRKDLYDALAKERDELASEIARLTAERDQALAQASAAAMEMRERAAEHAWNKRDLLADAEKKQIDAGLTGRDYYGRRLEAELLSRTIRALPIDPDAQKALDKLLAKARADAWDEGHRNYPSGKNPYRKSKGDSR